MSTMLADQRPPRKNYMQMYYFPGQGLVDIYICGPKGGYKGYIAVSMVLLENAIQILKEQGGIIPDRRPVYEGETLSGRGKGA